MIEPSLLFADASKLWLESRSFTMKPSHQAARFIRKTTEASYRQYVDSLYLFFAKMRLEQIHLGHLRSYQEARIAGAPPFVRYRRPQDAKPKVHGGKVTPAKGKQSCPAAPKKVNQELCILKMIMRRANCWIQELDEFYEPFSEDAPDVPRALSAEDQKKWLDIARARQRWWIVHWYSVLAFETSMSTNEIRSLRIGDVNLEYGILSVPPAGGKNKYRVRTIPLYSAEVKWSLEQLLSRAEDLGARAPLHYLFPFRRPPAPFDPTRPMTVSGIKKQWEEVRQASGLTWFRPYDTRHTAISRWAEAGIAPEMIRSMAGHVSERMMRHYTHISEAAKRRAMATSLPRIGPKSEKGEWLKAPFYTPERISRFGNN